MSKTKSFILLNILLLVYSTTGILSKSAGLEAFLSFKFCLFYGGMIFILGIYAIFWQQIIKNLPLSAAYANKAITIIWGMVWSVLFFGDSISKSKIIGAILVISGIILFAFSENSDLNKGEKNE